MRHPGSKANIAPSIMCPVVIGGLGVTVRRSAVILLACAVSITNIEAAPLMSNLYVQGEAGVTVAVWHYYDGPEAEALEDVVRRFNEASTNTGVRVETRAIPFGEFFDEVFVELRRGHGPDVFFLAQDRLGALVVEGGFLRPVDEYMDADLRARHFPICLEAMTYRGSTYGVPLNFKLTTLVYNKALLDSPPGTSTDLARIAKTLTVPEEQRYGLSYQYENPFYHSGIMHAFGDGITPSEGFGLVIESEGNAKSLELVRRWRDVEEILPGDSSMRSVWDAFMQGRSAMTIDGPWLIRQLPADMEYGLALLPTVEEADNRPMRPWVTVEGAYISQSSRHPNAAFGFIRHLTELEAAIVMTVNGQQLATHKDVYADERVQGDRVAMAYRRQLDFGVPIPNHEAMVSMWSPAVSAMRMALRDRIPARTALRTAQEEHDCTIAAIMEGRDTSPCYSNRP